VVREKTGVVDELAGVVDQQSRVVNQQSCAVNQLSGVVFARTVGAAGGGGMGGAVSRWVGGGWVVLGREGRSCRLLAPHPPLRGTLSRSRPSQIINIKVMISWHTWGEQVEGTWKSMPGTRSSFFSLRR
jgi:hypothetical protein